MKTNSFSAPAIIAGLLLFFTSAVDAQPGFRSDAEIEFDENGNITRYDSCWSWSFEGGHSIDFDSIFSHFFDDHPFMFDFDLDDFPSFDYGHQDMDHFFNFPDSAHLLVPHFGSPDLERLFDEHMDMIQRFYHSHPFPADSIRFHYPDWQSLPGRQKKSARTIDI